MKYNIFIHVFLFLIFFNLIFDIHSAPSSSVLANSVKYKAPKIDKTYGSNRKNKGGNDDDTDEDDDGSKFVEKYIVIFLILFSVSI
jgi:hypothetical protein